MANNRRAFGPMLPGVDHLPHTLDLQRNAFSKGLPQHGVERADELERLVTLHGAENIAAVIVEPMSASAGVILPPVGYLQRLREITAKHGILLIFDEVITGFGRVGEAFAAQRWGVTPDILTCAKGLTNGAIPMGAVFVADRLYDAFMQGPESVIEFFHGYTYSNIRSSRDPADKTPTQKAIDRSTTVQPARPTQRDRHPHRRLVAGIQFAAHADGVGKRGYEVFRECFENGLLVRAAATPLRCRRR